jgi:hypothetical protein
MKVELNVSWTHGQDVKVEVFLPVGRGQGRYGPRSLLDSFVAGVGDLGPIESHDDAIHLAGLLLARRYGPRTLL